MAAAVQIGDAERERQPGLDHEVIVIGSGFSGLAAGVTLRKLGIASFVILEREREFGGTWVQHRYPGLEIDLPFFVYSYPFEPKWDWSRLYPPGEEYAAYTRHVAEKYDLVRRIRCNAAVARAAWDEAANVWRVALASGETLVSRFLVSATGLLVVPKLPALSGIETFAGPVMHTARWDHGVDLRGKRVAVIGTGATAIQVVPAIAERVAQLDVYQRTPIWLMPKPNPKLSPAFQRALRAFPFLQRAMRWGSNLVGELFLGLGFVNYTRFPGLFRAVERSLAASVRAQVNDPALHEKLIPKYAFFCKRPSFSNGFYAAFNRPNVALVTEPIARVTRDAIVTADGAERSVDALVCATGYQVFDRTCMPGAEILGRGGRSLGELWESERFQAYEGATLPGFPNLFLYMGPYSNAGVSYFLMLDTQSKHLERCLREARRRGANFVEVKPAAHARDFAKVLRRRERTVFFGGGCAGANSYYYDARGDTPGLRPVTGFEHWIASRTFDLGDYAFEWRRPAAHTTR
jgi:cation diffusion facilitator CzcD-associated flavoprotein CzcO